MISKYIVPHPSLSLSLIHTDAACTEEEEWSDEFDDEDEDEEDAPQGKFHTT